MKKLTKKLLATLCATVLILTTCVGNVVMADSVMFDLNSLGITSGFDFSNAEQSYVTRGEFAQIVINMMAQQDVAKTLSNEVIFGDTASTPYNGAINLLYKQGFVSGVGNGNYEPERYVRYAEACKILVSVLGYTPALSDTSLNAYVYQAGTIGVTYDVVATGEFITADQLLKMVYNTIDIDKMVSKNYGGNVPASYEIDEGNTFRNNIASATPAGLVKLRGIVTADVTSYLYSQRDNMKDTQLEVDGMMFNYAGVAPVGLVGMEVEMFVTTTATGSYDKVTSITATNKNNVKLLDGTDINSFSLSRITYRNTDKSYKKETISLGGGTKYIYNNNLDLNFVPASVALDNNTIIRVIDNNEDEVADVVFIYSYEDKVVEAVNKETNVITLKSQLNGALNLEVNLEKTGVRYDFFDAEGNKLALADIEPEDVISFAVSKDGFNVRGVVSKQRTSGMVQMKDGNYVTVGGVEYLSNANFSRVSIGTNVNIWINYRGEIADFEEKSYYEEGGANYAYIYATGTYMRDTEVTLIVPGKLAAETTETVNVETGEITTTGKLAATNSDVMYHLLASKVRVNGVIRKSTDEATINMINHHAVKYSLNSEGKINSIDFLESLKEYRVDPYTNEYLLNEDGSYQVKSETVSKSLKYSSSQKIFGFANCLPFGIDSETMSVCLPTARGAVATVSDEKLVNFKFVLENGFSATVSAYEVDEDSHIAEFVIFEFPSSSMNVGDMPDPQLKKQNIALVQKVGRSLDPETEEEVMSFEMLTIGAGSKPALQTMTVSPLIPTTAPFDVIRKGDLVAYSYDAFGRLDNMTLIKAGNDYDADKTENAGTNFETHTYSVKDITYNEIDNNNLRWVDNLKLYSREYPDSVAVEFNIPQMSSLAPVVFILDEQGSARVGSMKDISYGDKVCVYLPQEIGNVLAIVIYR